MQHPAAPDHPLSRLRERAGVRVARALRTDATDAEQMLWRHLRNRQLAGHKFRRQHPIGRFVADFVCLEAALLIEVDGGQHFQDDGIRKDADRTQALNAAGFTVLRFDNRQVLAETQAVLQTIVNWLQAHHPHPHPLPHAGEGVNTRKDFP